MAHDWLRLQRMALDEFDTRLAAVRDWHAPTPDREWDVHDLVKHVVDEQRWVAPLLSGLSMREARGRLHPIGADLVAEWQRYAGQATDAWGSTPPDAPVELSSDRVRARDYLIEATSDVIIHTWDLARATRSDETLPDDLVQAAWEYFSPIRDTLEGTGLYETQVDLAADAPLQQRLLALTGRDPR